MRRTVLALVLAGVAGCGNTTVCGPGTVGRFDSSTGDTVCIAADGDGGVSTGVQCDPATAAILGGVCAGDPTKFPTCGANTMLDPASHMCVPTGTSTPTPKPCDATQPAGTFCVNGVVRFLKDDAYTMATPLEVRVYDPFAFLGDPSSMPLKTVTVDSMGTYTANGVTATGSGYLAVAVTDAGGPKTYVLTGVGGSGITPGGKYTINLYATEASLVAGWDVGAGLSGSETFEKNGAYVARYVNAAIGKEQGAPPVAGVVLQFNDTPAPKQFFFKPDLKTLDATLKATDAATGAVVQRVTANMLGNYSGMGAGITWEEVPGASVPGVVFVQYLHPKAM